MLPDKTTKCHRTGFEKTCFECVTQHGCRLWKHVRLQADNSNGQINSEHWDCADSLAHVYAMNLMGRAELIAGNVDQLRKEVAQSNDAGMASALAGLNKQVATLAAREVEPMLPFMGDSPKLIQNGAT